MADSGDVLGRRAARGALVALLACGAVSALAPFARAGAESRGGLGHVYLKTYYAHSDADSGFDSNGDEMSLVSNAFLDRLTSLFAHGGKYDETDFGIYGEFGLTDSLDLVLSTEWKDIEKSFRLEGLGIVYPIDQKSSGLGDVNAGLKYQFLADPLPLAAGFSFRIPTYSTSVHALRLDTLDSSNDRIALGNGTTDLTLGLEASSGPLLPWVFADLSAAYVLADLEHRKFSDSFNWSAKLGVSRWGLGCDGYLGGNLSTRNGSASDTITQDLLHLDPKTRVVVLNDQEWLQVGGDVWYGYDGLGVQAGYATTLSGTNTVKNDRLEIGVFVQR